MLVALDQRLEVQQGLLVVILYFHQLPQQVVAAAVQDHQLKTVRLAVQVAGVLEIVVLVAVVLVVKETTGPQVQQIKPVVVVAQVLLDQLMAMVAMEPPLVFLAPVLLTLAVAAAVVLLWRLLLELVVQVAAVQGLVILLPRL